MIGYPIDNEQGNSPEQQLVSYKGKNKQLENISTSQQIVPLVNYHGLQVRDLSYNIANFQKSLEKSEAVKQKIMQVFHTDYLINDLKPYVQNEPFWYEASKNEDIVTKYIGECMWIQKKGQLSIYRRIIKIFPVLHQIYTYIHSYREDKQSYVPPQELQDPDYFMRWFTKKFGSYSDMDEDQQDEVNYFIQEHVQNGFVVDVNYQEPNLYKKDTDLILPFKFNGKYAIQPDPQYVMGLEYGENYRLYEAIFNSNLFYIALAQAMMFIEGRERWKYGWSVIKLLQIWQLTFPSTTMMNDILDYIYYNFIEIGGTMAMFQQVLRPFRKMYQLKWNVKQQKIQMDPDIQEQSEAPGMVYDENKHPMISYEDDISQSDIRIITQAIRNKELGGDPVGSNINDDDEEYSVFEKIHQPEQTNAPPEMSAKPLNTPSNPLLAQLLKKHPANDPKDDRISDRANIPLDQLNEYAASILGKPKKTLIQLVNEQFELDGVSWESFDLDVQAAQNFETEAEWLYYKTVLGQYYTLIVRNPSLYEASENEIIEYQNAQGYDIKPYQIDEMTFMNWFIDKFGYYVETDVQINKQLEKHFKDYYKHTQEEHPKPSPTDNQKDQETYIYNLTNGQVEKPDVNIHIKLRCENLRKYYDIIYKNNQKYQQIFEGLQDLEGAARWNDPVTVIDLLICLEELYKLDKDHILAYIKWQKWENRQSSGKHMQQHPGHSSDRDPTMEMRQDDEEMKGEEVPIPSARGAIVESEDEKEQVEVPAITPIRTSLSFLKQQQYIKADAASSNSVNIQSIASEHRRAIKSLLRLMNVPNGYISGDVGQIEDLLEFKGLYKPQVTSKQYVSIDDDFINITAWQTKLLRINYGRALISKPSILDRSHSHYFTELDGMITLNHGLIFGYISLFNMLYSQTQDVFNYFQFSQQDPFLLSTLTLKSEMEKPQVAAKLEEQKQNYNYLSVLEHAVFYQKAFKPLQSKAFDIEYSPFYIQIQKLFDDYIFSWFDMQGIDDGDWKFFDYVQSIATLPAKNIKGMQNLRMYSTLDLNMKLLENIPPSDTRGDENYGSVPKMYEFLKYAKIFQVYVVYRTILDVLVLTNQDLKSDITDIFSRINALKSRNNLLKYIAFYRFGVFDDQAGNFCLQMQYYKDKGISISQGFQSPRIDEKDIELYILQNVALVITKEQLEKLPVHTQAKIRQYSNLTHDINNNEDRISNQLPYYSFQKTVELTQLKDNHILSWTYAHNDIIKQSYRQPLIKINRTSHYFLYNRSPDDDADRFLSVLPLKELSLEPLLNGLLFESRDPPSVEFRISYPPSLKTDAYNQYQFMNIEYDPYYINRGTLYFRNATLQILNNHAGFFSFILSPFLNHPKIKPQLIFRQIFDFSGNRIGEIVLIQDTINQAIKANHLSIGEYLIIRAMGYLFDTQTHDKVLGVSIILDKALEGLITNTINDIQQYFDLTVEGDLKQAVLMQREISQTNLLRMLNKPEQRESYFHQQLLKMAIAAEQCIEMLTNTSNTFSSRGMYDPNAVIYTLWKDDEVWVAQYKDWFDQSRLKDYIHTPSNKSIFDYAKNMFNTLGNLINNLQSSSPQKFNYIIMPIKIPANPNKIIINFESRQMVYNLDVKNRVQSLTAAIQNPGVDARNLQIMPGFFSSDFKLKSCLETVFGSDLAKMSKSLNQYILETITGSPAGANQSVEEVYQDICYAIEYDYMRQSFSRELAIRILSDTFQQAPAPAQKSLFLELLGDRIVPFYHQWDTFPLQVTKLNMSHSVRLDSKGYADIVLQAHQGNDKYITDMTTELATIDSSLKKRVSDCFDKNPQIFKSIIAELIKVILLSDAPSRKCDAIFAQHILDLKIQVIFRENVRQIITSQFTPMSVTYADGSAKPVLTLLYGYERYHTLM